MTLAAAAILPLRYTARRSSHLFRHKLTGLPPPPPQPHRAPPHAQQRARRFFSLPGGITAPARPAHLMASRRLPYPAEALYCVMPRIFITQITPIVHHIVKRESHASEDGILPGRVVEAVSGKGAPSIRLPHAADDSVDAHGRPLPRPTDGGLFESLVTRWTVTPSPPSSSESSDDWADVELSIRYQFANPMYQLATGSVADEVAGLMVGAFERRARELLGSMARAAPASRQ
ncbi:cyclase/dehydrase [Magnaporthiopsis poae ATCC 64411]|uniref:Cyclase/dehydrase n=1 Tax=Magnaporthiopsis poae (strain ATCC 64411 / 73-15) TaxID=644358 RepID=A0A0C4E8R6_MAGP6|nr:cyclase/dehydrase [Magnaporthiopsis poae ATCC 64411]